MMQVLRRAARGAAAVLAATALAACDNEVPTATGSDLFPGGESPTTIIVDFSGTDLILREEVHAGFGDAHFAPFSIVANSFDGALDARTLTRFTDIPDSVTYVSGGSRNDSITGYAAGRVKVAVDSMATFPRNTIGLRLYELTQAWDSTTVDWTYAQDRPGAQIPWTTPGGTLGPLLDVAFWFPADTAQKDTVTWQLDSAAVHRLRAPDHPGVVAVIEDQAGVRIQLGDFVFEGDARPSGKADTLITVRTGAGPQSFIYTPEAPDSPEVLQSGGLRGDRSLLTLDLDLEVESCTSAGVCSQVPLRDVTLNRAFLVFEPVAVPDGHRPLTTPRVQLRSVAEPELGRFAPLGQVLAADTIHPSAFRAGTARTFELDMTPAILLFLARQRQAIREEEEFETEMSLAVLTDFENPDLGLLWFERSPRLTLVYTLPLNPTLP